MSTNNRKPHLDEATKQKIVALFEAGKDIDLLAETFHVHAGSIRRWRRTLRTNKDLSRSENPGSGAISKINGDLGIKLLDLIKKPAKTYGFETDLWTTTRIKEVCEKELNIEISRMGVFRFLRKAGFSYKTPQSKYYEADPKARRQWTTKTLIEIQQIIRRFNAILYFADESNLDLSPVIGKTWSPVGEKTTIEITANRGSISLISALSNDGKLLFDVYESKRFKAADIVIFLEKMLDHHKKRHLVVVLDQAPCHKAKLVQEFAKKQKRLHLFFLPPRSPDYNPDEKLWNYLKNISLKGHQHKTTKDLKRGTKKVLRKISKNKKLLKGIYLRSPGAHYFGWVS